MHARSCLAVTALAALCLGPLQAQGTFTPFGKGCPGTAARVPTLGATGEHTTGKSTVFVASNLRPSSPGVMFVGFSKTSWGPIPLPWDLSVIGMRGCSQYVSGDILYVLPSNASGQARLSLPLPDDLGLVGLSFYQQYMLVDPGANTPLKIVTANAGDLKIGCGDGPESAENFGFDVTLPKIDAISFPGARIDMGFEGKKFMDCCGAFATTRGCRVSAKGWLEGKVPAFTVSPLKLTGIANTAARLLCGAIQKVTGGTVTCNGVIGVRFGGVVIGGRNNRPVTFFLNDCRSRHGYDGNGLVLFPNGITAGFQASWTIKLPLLPPIKMSRDFVLTGTPKGSWWIDGRLNDSRLHLKIELPELKAKAGFQIPVIRKWIGIDLTIPTSGLKGEVEIGLPKPAIKC